MSKYTTEVRYICEHYAGLNESVGYPDIEQVIKNCLPKVFDFNFPIFDENYRSVIETKILRHFYTREIGLETVALWKLKLNTKLNEIMPFYNQLYKSELIEFNPLYDVELIRERKTTGNGTRDVKNGETRNGETNITGSQNGNTHTTEDNTVERNLNRDIEVNGTQNNNVNEGDNSTTTGNGKNMYSDTPQGAITDLEAGKYLTNATIDTVTNTTSGTKSTNSEGSSMDKTTEGTNEDSVNDRDIETDSSSNTKSDTITSSNMDGFSNTTLTNTEDYIEHVLGSNGGKSFAERLIDFRKTFLNIDMMVINDLEELFFQLW